MTAIPGRTWSPEMPGPDEAITWTESHDCQPSSAAIAA